MDYFLTEEQEMIRDLARQITKEKIIPVRAELDETEEYPREILRHLAEADLFGLEIEEEYGGTALGALAKAICLEELAKGCVGVATAFAATGLGAFPIMFNGSKEMKEKYLPGVAAGTTLAAFGLTESTAGSDVAGIQTTAVRDGDHYILNGTKQWITNAGEADIYTIIALTDRTKGPRGASFFVVEADDPGFSFGKKEKKMGIRCSATGELIMTDCRIPADRLIGKEGQGFIIAMKTFDHSRPGVGALGLGVAQAALDEAIRHAKTRVQFGKPIMAIQAVQHMIADMATSVEASRALIYAVARYMDSGVKNFSKFSAMAKLFPTDTAMKVTTDALQVMGGTGYMREYPVEKMMRDAKILQIYEGANQVQRNIIGQELNKEYSRLMK